MSASNSSATSLRLGLYGGSFDPVHEAHLALARSALNAVGLDRVIFVPTARSPLKARRPEADDGQRKQMLKLATKDQPGMEVDDFELRKGGVSYSLETADYFRCRCPQARLFWIVGADQFGQLERWHRIEDLAERVTFLVFARPGASVARRPVRGLRFDIVHRMPLPHSSSEVRERCRRGRSITGMVPKAVEAFISEHSLYK